LAEKLLEFKFSASIDCYGGSGSAVFGQAATIHVNAAQPQHVSKQLIGWSRANEAFVFERFRDTIKNVPPSVLLL
jgi:hypothetical protein